MHATYVASCFLMFQKLKKRIARLQHNGFGGLDRKLSLLFEKVQSITMNPIPSNENISITGNKMQKIPLFLQRHDSIEWLCRNIGAVVVELQSPVDFSMGRLKHLKVLSWSEDRHHSSIHSKSRILVIEFIG